jgi:hypothetical protein
VSNEAFGVKIVFQQVSAGEANRAAAEMRNALLGRADDITVSIEKDDPDSQDAGQTLVLLFGSAAAIAIAEGIKAFLAKRPAQRDGLTIKTTDGDEIVATGEAASKLDAPALVKALQRRRNKSWR